MLVNLNSSVCSFTICGLFQLEVFPLSFCDTNFHYFYPYFFLSTPNLTYFGDSYYLVDGTSAHFYFLTSICSIIISCCFLGEFLYFIFQTIICASFFISYFPYFFCNVFHVYVKCLVHVSQHFCFRWSLPRPHPQRLAVQPPAPELWGEAVLVAAASQSCRLPGPLTTEGVCSSLACSWGHSCQL